MIQEPGNLQPIHCYKRPDPGKKPCLKPLIENLDTLTLIKETLLMGFRYAEGPDKNLFRLRFHRDIEDFIPATIAAWRERNLMACGCKPPRQPHNAPHRPHEKTALTKEGLLFLNLFLIDAFRELDASFPL
jgi:oxygen-independent coproporphyrinogen-3 oxidase